MRPSLKPARNPSHPVEVCLVVMPYAPLGWPPLGVSLLKSTLETAGISSQVLYANHWFAKQIGFRRYDVFCNNVHHDSGLGEWTFSGACFPDFEPDHETYLERTLPNEVYYKIHAATKLDKRGDLQDELWALRKAAEEFLPQAVQRILDLKPRIVACGSTFQQNCAVLALLKQIKQWAPEVVTIIGGSNCEAEMGLALKENFAWLDYVISGEADLALPRLCQGLLAEPGKPKSAELPLGVIHESNLAKLKRLRASQGPDALPVIMEEDLDGLPDPDFSDYFTELKVNGFSRELGHFLPFEGSRGCWKGNRQPCNFCGLSGQRMRYRSKSSQHILEQLKRLHDKYGLDAFMAADSILSMDAFNGLLPALKQAGAPYKIFYETSSTLGERHIKLLAEAGVRWIQPGIETFDEEIIGLLNKGNSPLSSIAFLKFALEQGVRLNWNALYRVPGDDDTQYQRIVELLPLLHHLQPPAVVAIGYQRFSRYEKESSDFKLDLVPRSEYSYIYPLPPAVLQDLVYDLEVDQSREKWSHNRLGYLQFKRSIFNWRTRFWGSKWLSNHGQNAPELTVRSEDGHSLIRDTRDCTSDTDYTLEALDAAVLSACRKPARLKGIKGLRGCADERELKAALERLMERKLVIHMGSRYLSLATNPPQRPLPGGFPRLEQPEQNLWSWVNSISQ